MKIAVVGTGYIGISTVIYFAKAENDIEIYGIDVNDKKIKLLKKGLLPQKDLLEWLEFNPKSLLKKVKFYNNFKVLNNIKFDVVFVAIPTEKDGKPYFEILNSVIKEINNSTNKDTLIIIESTLMPGVSDEHIKPYLPNFVVAPRRDWFTDKGKTLETLPRIVGGNTDKNTKNAIDILSNVCKDLHPCNYKESELVKAVENSIRHIGAVYAQELAWGYPDLNIRKILKLASTKWNVPEYYPNILGTAGYCIPLSSRYILQASKEENKNSLHISKTVIESDDNTSYYISQIIKDLNPKSIGILGIAYLSDIKVHILSGALRLIKYFENERIYEIGKTDIVAHYKNFEGKIKVHDSLYNKKELKTITKLDTFKFPNNLDKFEIIVLTAGHKEYIDCNKKILIEKTKNCRFILDVVGIWDEVKFKCPYIIPGTPNWLKKIK